MKYPKLEFVRLNLTVPWRGLRLRGVGRSTVAPTATRTLRRKPAPLLPSAVSDALFPAATSRACDIESGMNKSDSLSISVVHPHQFNAGTSQTPGSQRLAAVSPDLGIRSALWGGTFLVSPARRRASIITACRKPWRMFSKANPSSSGANGESIPSSARAGDFLHVPAWLVHREINRSKEFPFRWVVIRSTSEPIVVNLPEDTWD